MKGYLYTMFAGADPGMGWRMTDPILSKVPTLGACMPNVRRVVVPGDMIFTVSGRCTGVRQYVVGGFQVAEKIDALAALARFPENKQRKLDDGSLAGNIIVNADGTRSDVDYHSTFEERLANYVVGKNPIILDTPAQIARGREETLEMLGEIFARPSKKLSEITGRWRKLDERQIEKMKSWLQSIKSTTSSE